MLAGTGPSADETPGGTERRPITLEDVRRAARVEVAAFLAILDACAFAPPSSAALVRAWHALASLDALLRGAAIPGASLFEANMRADGRNALCESLSGTEDDFVRSVFACAIGEPWAAAERPTDKELRRHRRFLLRSLARLDREARRRTPFPWRRWCRAAGVSLAALVAVSSVAFLLYRPRWRASYFPNVTLSGAPVLVTRIPTADQNWGLSGPGPGIPADGFSARFETCLRLSAPEDVEFSVGSDDGSRLFVDDLAMLPYWTDQAFTTRSESTPLPAGAHRVRLEYYDRSGAASLTFKVRDSATGRDLAGSLGLPAADSGECPP